MDREFRYAERLDEALLAAQLPARVLSAKPSRWFPSNIVQAHISVSDLTDWKLRCDVQAVADAIETARHVQIVCRFEEFAPTSA